MRKPSKKAVKLSAWLFFLASGVTVLLWLEEQTKGLGDILIQQAKQTK